MLQWMCRFFYAAGALIILSSMLTAAELPDPFLFTDGRRVKTIDEWPARRAELLQQILKIEYGELPPAPSPADIKIVPLISHTVRTLKAPHKQYKVICDLGKGRPPIGFVLDILTPPGDGPFPVILRGDWGWHKTSDDITREVLA